MTDFIAAQADLILPELVGGYAPEYVVLLISLFMIEKVVNICITSNNQLG